MLLLWLLAVTSFSLNFSPRKYVCRGTSVEVGFLLPPLSEIFTSTRNARSFSTNVSSENQCNITERPRHNEMCTNRDFPKFRTTFTLYNGSFVNEYEGLFSACQKDYPGTKPCTVVSLLDGFWLNDMAPAWVLSLQENCVGYTTDSSISMGDCIQNLGPQARQLTQCTCDMKIGVCCVKN